MTKILNLFFLEEHFEKYLHNKKFADFYKIFQTFTCQIKLILG